MDPNQKQDDQIQNGVQVRRQNNGQVSVNIGGKEEAPVPVSSNSQEIDPLTEFATHKPPEVSPEVERAGVTPVVPPSTGQQQINDLAKLMPQDPAHITKKDVKKAHQIEETGDVSSSRTWIAALLEFIEKKILRKEADQKIA